ncbi:MAG TPA: protein translocase subunit SecF [Candidatus Eremiobacteraceae bacterium]|nr:protein translocase subunit SecF [Candidatus Eremiobacteraceae bacterium]
MFFRNLNWDIIGQRRYWFALSGTVIVAGIIALIIHHGLPLGLSFTGGTTIDVKFTRSVTESQIQQALRGVVVPETPGVGSQASGNAELNASLEPLRKGEASIQLATKAGDAAPNDRAIISSQSSIADPGPVFAALDKAGLTVDRSQSQITAVGPSLSKEYLNNSLAALALALFLQLLYIAFRFGNQLRFGIVADLALIHDVLVMVGIYAIANRKADDAFLAALLTVIGYSVMDSIVIFDRIRENGRLMPDVPYDKMVNTSLLQTMTRSVNTLVTVVIVLVALLLFGGDTLKNFAFALLVGVISGAYSSIFIASPLLVIWKNFDLRRRASERAAAVATESAAIAAPGPTSAATRKVAPKPKRPVAPPPRYRRKRQGLESTDWPASDDGGVLTETEDGDATGEAEPDNQS